MRPMSIYFGSSLMRQPTGLPFVGRNCLKSSVGSAGKSSPADEFCVSDCFGLSYLCGADDNTGGICEYLTESFSLFSVVLSLRVY